jgi:hypothetical protein
VGGGEVSPVRLFSNAGHEAEKVGSFVTMRAFQLFDFGDGFRDNVAVVFFTKLYACVTELFGQ